MVKKDNRQAERAIQEAIRLNPDHAPYWGLLGEIYLNLEQWNSALKATEKGLSLDPEAEQCLEVRAEALVELQQYDEAQVLLHNALSLYPTNAILHNVQGTLHFHKMNYERSFESFGEALRINPQIPSAQLGLIETMKARNIIYRVFLNYYVWMSKQSNGMKWAIIIGGYFLIRYLQESLEGTPFRAPVVIAYLIFVYLTWTADILFDLMLRLDKFGQRALSPKRKLASTWVGGLLASGLVSFGISIFFVDDLRWTFIVAGLQLCFLVLPVATIFRMETRQNQQRLLYYSLGMFGLTVGNFLASIGGSRPINGFTILYFLGLIIFTWGINLLIMRRG